MAGSNDRPDPMEFLQQIFGAFASGGDSRTAAQDVWARATETKSTPEPSAAQQRENLTFALATRAVEALEDIALNTAAIRQRLERT
jgi:hypothetical protein